MKLLNIIRESDWFHKINNYIHFHFSFKILLVRIVHATLDMLIIAAIIFLSFLAASKMATDFYNPARHIFAATEPKLLELPAITSKNYYMLWAFFGIIASFALIKLYVERILNGIKKYSYSYILETMSQKYYGAPASNSEELAKKILGYDYPKELNADDLNEIEEIIDKNKEKIKIFLHKSNEKQEILFIDSLWGTGKTTTLLLALNDAKYFYENRYIYESAFKYTNNIGEFGNDLIGSIIKSLREMGCYIPNNQQAQLVANIFSGPKSIVDTVIGADQNYLTNEIIHKINKKFKILGINRELYIIIDDLDRLQGEDIIKILSILSMLRKMSFVKLIILADRSKLIENLRNYRVIDPEIYIEKYLPSPISVKIEAGYYLAEKICLAHFRKASGINNCKPAFAAVLMKVLSNKLIQYTDSQSDRIIVWPRNYNTNPNMVEGLPRQAIEILNIPSLISDIAVDGNKLFDSAYTWGNARIRVNDFASIITKLKLRNSNTYITQIFGKKEYEEVIASWIFDYASKNWESLGITIRDVMDVLRITDSHGYSKYAAIQFTQCFNQLFPEDKILINKNRKQSQN